MIFNTNSGGVTQDQLNKKVSELNDRIDNREWKHQWHKGVLTAGSDHVIITVLGEENDRRVINIYTDKFGVNPTSIEEYSSDNTKVYLYFDPQPENITVLLEVYYYEL